MRPVYTRSRCARSYSVIAITPERILRVVPTIEIATVIEVVYCANVFRKEKVQCPIKCHTNLFVQAGQLAEVNCPPHPPCEEAREIETENPSYARPSADRGQQPNGFERKWLRPTTQQHSRDIPRHNLPLAHGVLRGRWMRFPRISNVRYKRTV